MQTRNDEVIVRYYKPRRCCNIKSGCCKALWPHIALEIPTGTETGSYLVSFGKSTLRQCNESGHEVTQKCAIFYLQSNDEKFSTAQYRKTTYAITGLNLALMRSRLKTFIGEADFERLKNHEGRDVTLIDRAWSTTPSLGSRVCAALTIGITSVGYDMERSYFPYFREAPRNHTIEYMIENKGSASCASVVYELLVAGGIDDLLDCNTLCYHSRLSTCFAYLNISIAALTTFALTLTLLIAGLDNRLNGFTKYDSTFFLSVGLSAVFALVFIPCQIMILNSIFNLLTCGFVGTEIISQPASIATIARNVGREIPSVEAVASVIGNVGAPRATAGQSYQESDERNSLLTAQP